MVFIEKRQQEEELAPAFVFLWSVWSKTDEVQVLTGTRMQAVVTIVQKEKREREKKIHKLFKEGSDWKT